MMNGGFAGQVLYKTTDGAGVVVRWAPPGCGGPPDVAGFETDSGGMRTSAEKQEWFDDPSGGCPVEQMVFFHTPEHTSVSHLHLHLLLGKRNKKGIQAAHNEYPICKSLARSDVSSLVESLMGGSLSLSPLFIRRDGNVIAFKLFVQIGDRRKSERVKEWFPRNSETVWHGLRMSKVVEVLGNGGLIKGYHDEITVAKHVTRAAQYSEVSSQDLLGKQWRVVLQLAAKDSGERQWEPIEAKPTCFQGA